MTRWATTGSRAGITHDGERSPALAGFLSPPTWLSAVAGCCAQGHWAHLALLRDVAPLPLQPLRDRAQAGALR